MKPPGEQPEPSLLVKAAAVLYFMGASILVQFTTKARAAGQLRSGGSGLCSFRLVCCLLVLVEGCDAPQLQPSQPGQSAAPSQALFTIFKFDFPLTVALLQMAFISPVSYIIARPTVSRELLGTLAPLAMVNVLNVVCGLIGARCCCRGTAARAGLGG